MPRVGGQIRKGPITGEVKPAIPPLPGIPLRSFILPPVVHRSFSLLVCPQAKWLKRWKGSRVVSDPRETDSSEPTAQRQSITNTHTLSDTKAHLTLSQEQSQQALQWEFKKMHTHS